MTVIELLDQLIHPRPNGSQGLADAAQFIEATLRSSTPNIIIEEFQATPFGFALLALVALVLVLGATAALMRNRHAIALLLLLAVPVLFFSEMELLQSPVSGVLRAQAQNVIATFHGAPSGPLIVFSAHYDTATQFGDHVHWQYVSLASGGGLAMALGFAIAGLARRRPLPRRLVYVVLPIVVLPFLVGAVQMTVGPFARKPSPGALDNAGSVSVLLKLAERLAERPPGSQATVQLVFLACEEERALGSSHFARGLRSRDPLAVINLELVGARGPLAYAREEGFLIRRFRPAPAAVALLQGAAQDLGWNPLRAMPLPGVMYTDGRSFLARGIPTVTILSYSEGGPRGLHSYRDSRSRLSVPALQQAVVFLASVLERVEHEHARREGVRPIPPRRSGIDRHGITRGRSTRFRLLETGSPS